MTKTASIKINGSSIGTEKINPFIFGHFVEDIRDHMDAMLAFELKDMDFENQDVNRRGVSGSWFPVTNGKNTQFALEPAAPRHTGHSQKIRIFSNDDCFGGIAQKISIRGDVKYQFQLYARATIEIKFVKFEIIDQKTQEILHTSKIKLDSHDWKEYKGAFSASRPSSEAELRLTISSEEDSWNDSIATGMLWIDHFSILPEDAVGIVKKNVVEMTHDLNAGIMRIGGNYISAYHWQMGVGPLYERPVMLNEAWDHLANKYFGTDEFLHFCQALEVAPHICVNDGSGTPEEAARWVEYCNGSAETEMGALRANNGNTEPYDVKYWEIGNEVWGPWQTGHCSAEEYAHRYVGFAKAMKEADPSIKLLACGHTDPEWNRVVLEIAGEYIDYLTVHIYQGYGHFGYTMQQELSREDKYKAIVSYPEVTRGFLHHIRESIQNYPQVKLAITEYNTMYHPNNIRKGLPNEHTLEAAVANAANLNEFIRNCDIVEIGNFSDLVNGWLGGCIRVGDNYADQRQGKIAGWSGKNDVIYGTPSYYVLKMYANRDITYVVNNKVECDTFNVIMKNNRANLDHLPELDVVSAINEDKSLLTVFVVNRGFRAVDVEINGNDLAFNGKAKVGVITGSDIDSINDVFQPENITSSFKDIEVGQSSVCHNLLPHSIYVFEIEISF